MIRRSLRLALPAALLAAAIAFGPTRRWLADMLIVTGAHLDRIDDCEGAALSPEAEARIRQAMHAEAARRNGNGGIAI